MLFASMDGRAVACCALALVLQTSTAYHPTASASTRPVARSSETFTELPALLIPESVVPGRVLDADGRDRAFNVVLWITIDTTGRVEPVDVVTLSATDSAGAQAVRASLAKVRYVPRRLVQVLGPCVVVNEVQAHCGGPAPFVRPLRSRELFHVVVRGAT